jgi:putative intracellular protease/amidase
MILISWQFSKEDEECQRFMKDTDIQSLVKNAKYLKDVSFDDYSAIFYVGGHGPVFDLSKDEVNITLANKVSPSIGFEDLSH